MSSLALLVGALVLIAGSSAVSSPAVRRLEPERCQLRLVSTGRRAGRQVASDLPDLIDLVALGVDVGLSATAAIDLAVDDDLNAAARLLRSVREQDPEARLHESLQLFASKCPDSRIFVAAVTSALELGTPIAEALRRVDADLRALRRRQLETRARQLPVRLLFPLVLLILPAFALVTVVPVIVAAFSGGL
ncbi:MAG: tight adherence protein C [Candidatus Poriferisodalaceae bacterium]|jgi:tight adherence protein C